MNQLLFEGRFLAELTAIIVRQEDLKITRAKVDWERIYRLADYHRIAPLLYLGLLGQGEELPERWSERFFQRYQETLQYGEICAESEKMLLELFSERGATCTILSCSWTQKLYPVKEMAGRRALSLLADENSYLLMKGFLVDQGYETVRTYKGFGEYMQKPSGIDVELYHKLPFQTPAYRKSMSRILEKAHEWEGLPHNIYTFSMEKEFQFRMAKVAYHYVTDTLTLQEMLDLMLFHRALKESLTWDNVMELLKDFGVEELSRKILELSYLWFGTREDVQMVEQKEDLSTFDILEKRILSMGAYSGQETDEQALWLSEEIEREEEKDDRREGWEIFLENLHRKVSAFKKTLCWTFPDYRYMCSIYPRLEKRPVLLPLYWGIRGTRIMKRALWPKEKDT